MKCEKCGQEVKTKWIKIGDLEWYYDYLPEMTWEEAKKECEKLGGRLPTRIELLDLFDNHYEEIKKLSLSSSGNLYWSATTESNNTSYAWFVFLYYGSTNSDLKTTAGCYRVRCVR